MKVNVSLTHSCPTLCIPMDWSSLGSSVHGIFQASILEWVAISFSRGRGSGGIQKKKNSLLNIADCAADLKNKQCSALTLPQALKELTLSRSGIRCNGVSFPPYLSRLHPEAQKYIP